jgi:hypothetical protein
LHILRSLFSGASPFGFVGHKGGSGAAPALPALVFSFNTPPHINPPGTNLNGYIENGDKLTLYTSPTGAFAGEETAHGPVTIDMTQYFADVGVIWPSYPAVTLGTTIYGKVKQDRAGAIGWSNIDSKAIYDALPNAWDFTDQAGVAQNATITSAAVTPIGYSGATQVLTNGNLVSINGGAFSAADTTLSPGQSIAVRHTSAATPGSPTTSTITVAGVNVTFQSITSGVGFVASTVQPAAINNAFGSAVYTFTGADFSAGGLGVVFVGPLTNARTVSGIKIKGAGTSGADIALTQRAVSASGDQQTIWVCPDASPIVIGGVHNVEVTLSAASDWVGVACGTLINATTGVPTSTALRNAYASTANPLTTATALTIPANGIGVAHIFMNGSLPHTANNGTKLADTLSGYAADAVATHGALSDNFTAGAWTPSFNAGSQAGWAIISATWS